MVGESVSMEHTWNDTDGEKTEVLGENPVPLPLRPPQIPRELTWDPNPVVWYYRRMTYPLSHGTLFECASKSQRCLCLVPWDVSERRAEGWQNEAYRRVT